MSKSEKYLFLTTLVVFGLAVVLYFISYWVGNGFVIRWEKVSETKPQQVVVDTFDKNLFEFQITADSYLIVEGYKAGNIELNLQPPIYTWFFFCLAW